DMAHIQKDRTVEPLRDAELHHLIGGAVCLDFANTLYGHGRTPIHEYLFDYRDLVLWSRHAGILPASDAESLRRKAARQPNEALAMFHRAIALRETIFRVFSAIAQGNSPKPADLETINAARSEANLHSHIERAHDRFVIEWNDKTALERVLWGIALSAAELLTSEKVRAVRQCGGDTCDWLFVDTSRNHLRRWCSMSKCGNRAKVRRFIERKRRQARVRAVAVNQYH
ncbi:MAG: ABATE domain-containing protein, partial [Chloroflexota bacterium]